MADYFTTYQEVQVVGNLSEVEQEVIEKQFPSAKRDVLEIIGQTKYDLIMEAELVEPGDETEENPYTKLDFEQIRLAETYMAIPYVIVTINTVATKDGITKATGFDESRKENLSEFDLNSIEKRFKGWAKNILKTYLETYDPDEDDDDDICLTNDLLIIEI